MELADLLECAPLPPLCVPCPQELGGVCAKLLFTGSPRLVSIEPRSTSLGRPGHGHTDPPVGLPWPVLGCFLS